MARRRGQGRRGGGNGNGGGHRAPNSTQVVPPPNIQPMNTLNSEAFARQQLMTQPQGSEVDDTSGQQQQPFPPSAPLSPSTRTWASVAAARVSTQPQPLPLAQGSPFPPATVRTTTATLDSEAYFPPLSNSNNNNNSSNNNNNNGRNNNNRSTVIDIRPNINNNLRRGQGGHLRLRNNATSATSATSSFPNQQEQQQQPESRAPRELRERIDEWRRGLPQAVDGSRCDWGWYREPWSDGLEIMEPETDENDDAWR